ncbi:Bone morphogenetic protein 4,Protein decapentaplegic,Bone morphogenetic protein 6,Bone morphogenetic protein 2-A,Growth/differentiation factor 3,Bone morphogenetic protein 2,Univin,Bone morphogenetic protein 3,Protein DVR-1,Derriere protein,Protein 60A,Bone morphogenetic protein 2-B [Mytilus coruscus]|uniref:TGF-beta family profile domain-containing protein n=1 Tax=Mytilus coruscus TaxID=42192 RepID=A0A6J8DPD1_MYTCO|nr:Bone morphogenetic protein 4,Protein decapentaplegic,Bone morphogenetic protein 6,Bone morphogenetic protein 2-A,Growth/differentiation factor 3,Bone morphogenetic protein 2,Univin,Bone morphogenetic protein 3,Protein DVR-1,Derriere protein,Protein 60A,Bone morphogenetic protein 2-B [Mytilus coruscus]
MSGCIQCQISKFYKILRVVFFILLYLGLLTEAKKRKVSNETYVIERLSNLFGIDKVPVRIFNRSPPQYMLDLYNSITDSGGLLKRDSPYHADVVRSFPDRQWTQQMHFYYNISYLTTEEKILAAEFHVFKLRPKPSSSSEIIPSSHIIEVKIYQVLDPDKIYSSGGLKLLDAKRISVHTHGWLVFQVQKAVEQWVNGSSHNHGFLVTTTSMSGQHVNGSYVRFAQRREHHESKQPILVVYTDDGQLRHPNYISPNDEDYLEIKKDIERQEKKRNKQMKEAIRLLNEKDREEFENEHLNKLLGMSKRTRRSADIESKDSKKTKRKGKKKKNKLSKAERRERRRRMREQKRAEKRRLKNEGKLNKEKRGLDYILYDRRRRNCGKREMYVDFDEIGWSGWIISPKGYNAYHCKGECPFPLGQSQKPTNHATVQSIVHALKVGKDVSTPCCVPNKLYSISLLYFDDDENVILKQYDDMVAASCGCH